MTDPKNEAATLVDAFDAAARNSCYAEAQALRDYVARLAAKPAAPDVGHDDPIYARRHGWEDDGVVIRQSDMVAAREITAKGHIGYGQSIRRGENFVERVEAVALGHALSRAAPSSEGIIASNEGVTFADVVEHFQESGGLEKVVSSAAPSSGRATAADMAAFGASDAACYLYPGEDQQPERLAFCEGAAHAVSSPSSGHAMAEGATASQLVEKWELEYMACRDDHWGDSIAWQGAREIARRIDAERTPPTTNDAIVARGHADTEGEAMASFAHLNCPLCAGSGHVEDAEALSGLIGKLLTALDDIELPDGSGNMGMPASVEDAAGDLAEAIQWGGPDEEKTDA